MVGDFSLKTCKIPISRNHFSLLHMTSASYPSMTILWKMPLSSPESLTVVILLDFIPLKTLMGIQCGGKPVFDDFEEKKT